ncbi:hypothetical protein HDU67_003891, partial [Dinochytrium kinnereticum]
MTLEESTTAEDGEIIEDGEVVSPDASAASHGDHVNGTEGAGKRLNGQTEATQGKRKVDEIGADVGSSSSAKLRRLASDDSPSGRDRRNAMEEEEASGGRRSPSSHSGDDDVDMAEAKGESERSEKTKRRKSE